MRSVRQKADFTHENHFSFSLVRESACFVHEIIRYVKPVYVWMYGFFHCELLSVLYL